MKFDVPSVVQRSLSSLLLNASVYMHAEAHILVRPLVAVRVAV